jgi:hypothetical protein
VLETLGGVYHNDAVSRERELLPEGRSRFHQEHSGPLMKGLHEWMEAQLAEHKTEPNSGLGKAISYLLNHWPKLTLFLRQPAFWIVWFITRVASKCGAIRCAKTEVKLLIAHNDARPAAISGFSGSSSIRSKEPGGTRPITPR